MNPLLWWWAMSVQGASRTGLAAWGGDTPLFVLAVRAQMLGRGGKCLRGWVLHRRLHPCLL